MFYKVIVKVFYFDRLEGEKINII